METFGLPKKSVFVSQENVSTNPGLNTLLYIGMPNKQSSAACGRKEKIMDKTKTAIAQKSSAAVVSRFLQAKLEKQGAGIANATKIEKIGKDDYRIIFVAKGLKPLAPTIVSAELLEIMIADLHRPANK